MKTPNNKVETPLLPLGLGQTFTPFRVGAKFFIITALTLPIGIIAQESSPERVQINPQQQVHQPKKTSGCKDCEEVRQALKTSHAASVRSHREKILRMKHRSGIFSEKMKMKKGFARKYKPKTSYAFCFNWH